MSKDKVQDWLGHESVMQTERAYAFLRVEDLHRAVTKVDTGAADSKSR
jgi:integrase